MGERRYFGTDGIRGRANTHPMTPEVALRVGLAAGRLFMSSDERRHLVVIGNHCIRKFHVALQQGLNGQLEIMAGLACHRQYLAAKSGNGVVKIMENMRTVHSGWID